jgi:outer membrane receptor for ferrienterochelin and colicin
MQRKIYLLVLLTYLLLPFAGSAILNAQSSVIEGTVSDAQTGETLVGANILIQGTTSGTITDFDGNFKISNLKQGSYNLVISYISYDQQILNVKVTEGESSRLEVRLKAASLNLESVKVTGTRRTDTEMALMSSIRVTNLVANGISSQQIGRTQDKDAAEVLKRVPGITINEGKFIIVRGLTERYNSVLLNSITAPSSESDVRAFSFDVVPSSMIDNIIVYKSPAPELPADFGGAVVKVITKNTAEKNSLSLSYSTAHVSGTSFNDFYTFKGGAYDKLGFADQSYELPRAFPSTREMMDDLQYPPLNTDKKARLTEIAKTFNSRWLPTAEQAFLNQNFSMNSSSRFVIGKLTFGNISSVQYALSNNHDLQHSAFYQSLDTASNQRPPLQDFYNAKYTQSARIGVIHNWLIVFGNNQKIEFRNFFSHTGNKNTIIKNGIDYYSTSAGDTIRSTEMRFDTRMMYSGQLAGTHTIFNQKTAIDWVIGMSKANKNQPDIRRLRYMKFYNSDDPGDPNNGKYRLLFQSFPVPGDAGRLYLYNTENIYNAGMNIDQRFPGLLEKLSVKAGIFLEKRFREFSSRNIGLTAAGNYSMFIKSFLPLDSLFQEANYDYDKGIVYKESSPYNNFYKIDNNLSAAYLGINIPVGSSVKLYTGARMEKYYRLMYGFQKDPTVSPNVKYDTTNLFISANLSWNITEKQVLRGSWGQTVNRPEFREVSAFAYSDFEIGALFYGKQDLKSSYIDNFDIRYEWYPEQGEMITLSGFYKAFSSPIELSYLSDDNAREFQYQNADKATSLGVELDIRKNLGFVPAVPFMDKLMLIFNASVIRSVLTTSDPRERDRERVMQGQSPYIVNSVLYYQDDSLGLMVSLAYNRIGKRIVVVGTTNTPHTWEMPRNSLDFTLSKKVGKYLELKAGIRDILANPVQWTQFSDIRTDRNGDGSRESASSLENDSFSYTPGRQFNIGFTWRF